MRKLLGVLALVLLLAGCGQAGTTAEPPPPETEEPDEYEALIAATPVAQVEGESVSPDGRFEIRAEGASGEYVSGIQPPEFLQIVDRETGEVLWQDQGWPWQSVLWSPEGGFLALAYSARTWSAITILETEGWASWKFTLPDGSPIPEYTFLPEDWGAWQSENSLDLMIGLGGDGEEQALYQCSVWKVDIGGVTGESREKTLETLGSWDFTHDGRPETVELETIWFPGGTGTARDYSTLRVLDGEEALWEDVAAIQHAGQNSLYVLRLDEKDYLLQYVPSMGQGFCAYQYRIFSLDDTGEPVIYRENHVEFDINFGSPIHESFDIPEIAAFLREVHGYLDQARELVNTVWDEIDLGNVDYGDAAALEKALEDYQREMAETA
ncbi:hypothetical protein [uncultured Oscillibacter sp.]|uniref:hypothetical protein n=1 Tax=uncultured Oscillibacter sp. TaxID=876091 RepID=UPI002605BAAC|nr:hypothetical protein [uncultured Oscillibacter sp.]